jgi:hypothetical protein
MEKRGTVRRKVLSVNLKSDVAHESIKWIVMLHSEKEMVKTCHIFLFIILSIATAIINRQ